MIDQGDGDRSCVTPFAVWFDDKGLKPSGNEITGPWSALRSWLAALGSVLLGARNGSGGRRLFEQEKQTTNASRPVGILFDHSAFAVIVVF
jgi:hypothetical protein